jgi:alpha-amylase
MRVAPQCTYKDYAGATTCTLVPTLPDLRTESDAPAELPPSLVEKWKAEGRLDAERRSLDAFFARTRYPRAPRYYFIKWLTDWVREFGFDGYRMDTAKHFEESVSLELKREAGLAYADWRKAHPAEVRDHLPFYMVGEVYGYSPWQGRSYDFGDRKVDYFAHGYDALINFSFKAEIQGPLDSVYSRYAAWLQGGALSGIALLNYVDSHDDGGPYDRDRKDPLGAGTRLLLAPGGAQIYYGDELARPLRVPGANGDANLRSLMNWGDLTTGSTVAGVLAHWRRLGRFRKAHPAVGAGAQRTLQGTPYVFSRTLAAAGMHDRVVIALDQPLGPKTIPVGGIFADGTELTDGYTGTWGRVTQGAITLDTPFGVVLLAAGR